MMGDYVDVRWPAEWEDIESIWLSWPYRGDLWHGGLGKVQDVFVNVVGAIIPSARVCINADAGLHDGIKRLLIGRGVDVSRVKCYDHATNDVWCRDHGPVFVQDVRSGELLVVDWQFNSWGGKFAPWDLDNQIPRLIAESINVPRIVSPMILEAGAIEGNGAGVLITTEAVLLNENRNPRMSRLDVENELKRFLGVECIFWLGQGIEGDDTDGHIDDMVRFVKEDAVVSIVEKNSSSPNYKVLAENNERLQDIRSLAGSRVEVIDLPMPEPLKVDNWRLDYLPASYANFLIVNDRVIVPVFGQDRNDDRALGILREVFPSKNVVGVNAVDLVLEGGGIHCISQQQPKPLKRA